MSQTKKPPLGTVHEVPAGMWSASPASIASRRSRYISRKILIWPRQSWLRRYEATAYWEKVGGHSVADSWASTSFSRTACGASTQPTRKPGAKVFEKDPR